jgi:hypothetical protein
MKKKVVTKSKKVSIVGKKLFIRTITYHILGKVKRLAPEIGSRFIELEQASWIADSGRFMQAIENGSLSEVEPIRSVVFVNLDTATDIIEWKHTLPTEQK